MFKFPLREQDTSPIPKTEQENTLPYMVVNDITGGVLIYIGKIYKVTCKSKIPGFSNFSNKYRNPNLINTNSHFFLTVS